MARKELRILLPDTEPIESFTKAVATGVNAMVKEMKARNSIVRKEKLKSKIAKLQSQLGSNNPIPTSNMVIEVKK